MAVAVAGGLGLGVSVTLMGIGEPSLLEQADKIRLRLKSPRGVLDFIRTVETYWINQIPQNSF